MFILYNNLCRIINKRKCDYRMSFYDFVIKFYDGQDTIMGDIAQDMKDDSTFPKYATDWKRINDHLGHLSDHIDDDIRKRFKTLYERYEESGYLTNDAVKQQKVYEADQKMAQATQDHFLLSQDVAKHEKNDAWYWSYEFLTDEQNKILDAMADALSDTSYHELCHQLNVLRAEFGGKDDGKPHINKFASSPHPTYHEQKKCAIQSALYYGIFAKTLCLTDYAQKHHGYYKDFPYGENEGL